MPEQNKLPIFIIQKHQATDLSLGITLEKLREDCIAILIPEFVSKEEATAYIEGMYEKILEWFKNRLTL